MKVVIVEDEELSAKRLEKLVQTIDETMDVVAILDSVKSAVEWFRTHPSPELLFLDIHLGDGLSFEILEQIDIPCPIIFTTAYNEYAIKAFKFNSIDYLLKPIQTEPLALALNKHKKLSAQNTNEKLDIRDLAKAITSEIKLYRSRFLLNFREELISISTHQIAYFVSENKITYLIHCDGRKFFMDQTLGELEEELDPAQFFRIARHIIASGSAIHKIYQHFNFKLKIELVPAYPEEIILSRDKSSQLKEWLNK